MRIVLERVDFMPTTLEPGILYYAEKYGAAAHLCACGCGTKIRTPIAPTEWAIEDGPKGVSLCPSVGNWQQQCRSHYWITDGEVRWSGQWTESQVAAGRANEEARRAEYFDSKNQKWIRRIWRRIAAHLKR